MLYFFPNKPNLITINSHIVREKSDDSNWWAEIKKNGSRLCLRKDKEEACKHKSFNGFIFWNRHKQLLSYEPSQELLEELYTLKIPEGTHIDAELLHHKTKNIKHLIYVYDIYMHNGKQITETLEVRRKIIEDIFCNNYKHFVLSKLYFNDFENVFNKAIIQSENEGLVLKSKQGKIAWDLKKCQEVWWQLKIRKPCGSYSF